MSARRRLAPDRFGAAFAARAFARTAGSCLWALTCALLIASIQPARAEPLNEPDTLAAADSPQRSARIGVLAFRAKAEALKRWQPLAEHLAREIPDTRFDLEVFDNNEMDAAVASGAVDFVFVQPSHYVRLTYLHALSSPLATLVNFEGQTAASRFGGLIFTRSDRTDIEKLSDLRGRTIAAVDLNGLGGFQMQARELLDAGIRLPEDGRVEVTGQPQDQVVQAVLEGRADAGFVRTGLIEAMLANGELAASRLKPLAPQNHPGFPFVASTRLYPEWPVAAMAHVDPDLSRQVAAALLGLPHDGDFAQRMRIAGFTIPGDYRSIDELLRALRLPPFDGPPTFTLGEVWKRWQSVWIVLIGVIGTTLLVFISRLISRNNELLRAQSLLQSSNEEIRKLNLAVEQSPESIIITDLKGDIVYVNRAFVSNTGYGFDEVLGQNPRLLRSGKTPASVLADMWATLSAGKVWHGELINRRKDGSEYVETATLSPIHDEQGEVFGYLAIKQDITARREAEGRIHQLAFFDPLTGLPNRAQLRELLTSRLTREAHEHFADALILLNIDRFKLINDARGHGFGDALLKAVGQRLREHLHPGDTVARMTSDEFALLLPRVGEDEAQAGWRALEITEKLHTHFRSPFEVAGEAISITVSMGLTSFSGANAADTDEILRRADTALHRAKDGGGNQTAVFESHMGEVVAQSFRIEAELRAAIRQGQLHVHLQPQIDTHGMLYGAEVLIRWQHPERGMIPPALFIPIAEQSELIVELSEFIFRTAFEILARAGDQGAPPRLSINLSPRHFRKHGFSEWFMRLIDETGADPTRITLEVTEGLFIDDFDAISARMTQLSEEGVQFSIDDFGTGYSSLAYLKRLPLSEIKIDKSFIQDAPGNPGDAALVKAILAVADRMHLAVVAEGIETAEQAHFLDSRGEVIRQGYFYGRPDSAQSWLARWNATTGQST